MIAAPSPIDYRHLYVHVPFCARRCSYCDFAIAVRRIVPVDAFVRSVRDELRIRQVSGLTLDTVYAGGGTPSRLGAQGIGQLLAAVREVARVADDAEVTVEANPEDVSAEVVGVWREHGVNRLSIGVQSFDDRVLAWMHRVHDADAAARAVHAARAGGIDAFSVDLIFAVGEAMHRDWRRDLDGVLALQPDHVSLYGLTIEEGTPLGRWHARGEVVESPEERYETEFMLAHELLGAAGYEHYEVSNFALPGRRARHNSAYWRGVPYLGVGPSAHGFDGEERRWNAPALADWERQVAAGHDPMAGAELLTTENRIAESVYLGLRTTDGLPVTASEIGELKHWIGAGWIEVMSEGDAHRIRCTPSGWLRLDALAADLTARRSHS